MSRSPTHSRTDKTACRPDCPGCGRAETQCDAPEHTGWRLAGYSALVFLLPLALAVAGVMLAGESPTWQLVGALAGLAGGATAARAILRRGREVKA